jgi:hypothetical protein
LELARFSQAIASCKKYADLTGNSSSGLAMLAYAYGQSGREDQAIETVERVEQRGGLNGAERAALALAEHDIDGALTALSEAVQAHARPSIWLAVSPLFDPLRSLPRFEDLIEHVGLPRPDTNRQVPASTS